MTRLGIVLLSLLLRPAASAAHSDVPPVIEKFKAKDPGPEKIFADAVGYTVFPTVGKGGLGIGGARVAYRNGVAIFIMAKGGMMYEASGGGQKFSFTPVGK